VHHQVVTAAEAVDSEKTCLKVGLTKAVRKDFLKVLSVIRLQSLPQRGFL
jgi:hypothetical protein